MAMPDLTDDELYKHALRRAEALARHQGRAHCDGAAVRYSITEPDGTVRHIVAEWSWPKEADRSNEGEF